MLVFVNGSTRLYGSEHPSIHSRDEVEKKLFS